MKLNAISGLKAFLIELVLYSALVVAYYFLVLHFLGEWLHHLFQQNIRFYTAVALALIIIQGLVLEWVTRLLLALVSPREAR